MIRSIIFLFALILFSCNQTRPPELLLGNWKLLDTNSRNVFPHEDIRNISYEFINDSLVDTKRSHFRTVKGTYERDFEYPFTGTITRYKIEDDFLSIFNLTDSVWNELGKLIKVSKDTLVIETRKNMIAMPTNQRRIFIKFNYDLDKEPHLDQIALSSSGCFGRCPIMDIIINNKGDVTFNGSLYVNKIGVYTGHISKELYSKIEDDFRKAFIRNLEHYYYSEKSDSEAIYTTFCQNNQFIRSIHDYDNSGPDELSWANTKLRYLFHIIELTKLDSSTLIAPHHFSYSSKNTTYKLSKSQSFLLWNYIRQGVITDDSFHESRILNFQRLVPQDEEQTTIKNIKTDGRYYKLNINGRKPITIDIGINFFETNKEYFEQRLKTQDTRF